MKEIGDSSQAESVGDAGAIYSNNSGTRSKFGKQIYAFIYSDIINVRHS